MFEDFSDLSITDEHYLNVSLEGISKISILENSGIEPEEEKVLIRVSERNRVMRKKLNIPEKINLDCDTVITASTIEHLESEKIVHSSPSPQKKSSDPVFNKVTSCFLLYFVGENRFRSGIADTELKNFRKIFNAMVQKSENCHEAYFGLGKLNAFIGNYSEAIKYLKMAESLNQGEHLYEIWLTIVSDRNIYINAGELLKQRDLIKGKL